VAVVALADTDGLCDYSRSHDLPVEVFARAAAAAAATAAASAGVDIVGKALARPFEAALVGRSPVQNERPVQLRGDRVEWRVEPAASVVINLTINLTISLTIRGTTLNRDNTRTHKVWKERDTQKIFFSSSPSSSIAAEAG